MENDSGSMKGSASEQGRRGFPPQLTRLIVLTVMIVVVYFVARHFLVPASFGQYGHYRGDAHQEIAARPILYAGRATCEECHSDEAAKLSKSEHKTISCETCHGPNAAHADDPSQLPGKIANPTFCVRCHGASPSRPAKFPQIDPAGHNTGEPCLSCHQPHSPTDAPEKK